jgi:alpha-1,2-glucosyltransferase
METATPSQRRLFWAILIAIFVGCALYAAQGELRGDEYVHFEQVLRFVRGDYRILGDALTTIPGYHLLIAAGMRALGTESLGAARILSGFALALATLAFYRLRRDAQSCGDLLVTAQFLALPILLPFAFLVYTDTLSLAFVLWAAWAAGRQRHWFAATFLVAAMAVRQNNVLWIALFTLPLLMQAWQRRSAQEVVPLFLSLLPYGIAGLAFVAYWLWNGSVSLSPLQAGMHPDFSLHAGNLVYFCFLAGILFALPAAEAWGRYWSDVRARPILLLVPLGLAIVYWLAFKVDHPYNLGQPVALRNWLLYFTLQSWVWRATFGAVAVFGAVGLLWQRWLTPTARGLWPLTIVFLSMSWLIEQRYCLIPFALLLAWRKPSSWRCEWITLALWIFAAVLFFWGMISGQLYL